MKARLYAVFAVLIVLAMLLTLNAGAQGQPVPDGEYRTIIVTSPDDNLPVPYSVRVGPASEVSGQITGAAVTFTPSLFAGQTGIAYGSDQGVDRDYDHIYYSHGIHASGTNLWVAEQWGLRVLRYNTATLTSNMTPIGRGGQQVVLGTINTESKELYSPADVATDVAGNIYVVDSVASHVLKFDSTGTTILGLIGPTFPDGTSDEHLDQPVGIAVDDAGNVYVSDMGNNRIRIYNSSLSYVGQVTGLNQPHHISIYGSLLFVSDSNNDRIVIYDITNPDAPVQSGDPIGSFGSGNGQFDYPEGVVSDGTHIFVADTYNNRVQIFDYTTRMYQTTLGVTDQTGTDNAHFVRPTDVALDSAGNLYVADPRNNHRVQKFVKSTSPVDMSYKVFLPLVLKPALSGSAQSAQANVGIASDPFDYVRVDTIGTTMVPYIPGTGYYNRPSGVTMGEGNTVYFTESRGGRLVKLDSGANEVWTKGVPGVGVTDNLGFNEPFGVAVSESLGKVFVADTGNDRVAVYNTAGVYQTEYDTWDSIRIRQPYGIAVDSTGNVYVTDRTNNRIVVFNGSTGAFIRSVAVTAPMDVAVDEVGGRLYVVENPDGFDDGTVRAYDLLNNLSPVVFSIPAGRAAEHISDPSAVAVDGSRNWLYVADYSNGDRIQVFSTLDASYVAKVSLGNSSTALGYVRSVHGLAVDAAGNLYVADLSNHRIQKFVPVVVP